MDGGNSVGEKKKKGQSLNLDIYGVQNRRLFQGMETIRVNLRSLTLPLAIAVASRQPLPAAIAIQFSRFGKKDENV